VKFWRLPTADCFLTTAPMRDQASTLRNLLHQRSTNAPVSAGERARIVVFTSGKGGVGKSVLAVNVAVTMAHCGARVCLLDANTGTSSVEWLCGLSCSWNASHFWSGAKSLHEVIVKGPYGINVLTGCGGLIEAVAHARRLANGAIEQLASLESAYDVLIFDAGSGSTAMVRALASVADRVQLIMTPEPTAIADAYATFKSWQGIVSTTPDLLVNRVSSSAQAREVLNRFGQTVELFLRLPAPSGSWIPEDASVSQSVATRQPFVTASPDSSAAQDVRSLTQKLLVGAKPTRKSSVWERMMETVS
jgi:flagellar biosynthesis protein FlhG